MTGHPTEDFPKLLRKFEQLIQRAKDIPLTDENAWKAHGQLLLIKAWGHLASIETLGKSAIKRDEGAEQVYVDHGSLAVLGRSAYETYVLFNFIFLEQDPELQKFRHQVWRLSGLMSRAKLNRPKALPPWRLEQIEREAQQIAHLKEAITSNSLFAELDDRTQKNVKKGEGVRLGAALIDLAVKAGLPRQYSADMYTHFCNYSHASSISAFQISETLNDGTSSIMARANIAFCCLLLVQMIMAYTEFFDEIDVAVASDDELANLLALWLGMGRMVEKTY